MGILQGIFLCNKLCNFWQLHIFLHFSEYNWSNILGDIWRSICFLFDRIFGRVFGNIFGVIFEPYLIPFSAGFSIGSQLWGGGGLLDQEGREENFQDAFQPVLGVVGV